MSTNDTRIRIGESIRELRTMTMIDLFPDLLREYHKSRCDHFYESYDDQHEYASMVDYSIDVETRPDGTRVHYPVCGYCGGRLENYKTLVLQPSTEGKFKIGGLQ